MSAWYWSHLGHSFGGDCCFSGIGCVGSSLTNRRLPSSAEANEGASCHIDGNADDDDENNDADDDSPIAVVVIVVAVDASNVVEDDSELDNDSSVRSITSRCEGTFGMLSS